MHSFTEVHTLLGKLPADRKGPSCPCAGQAGLVLEMQSRSHIQNGCGAAVGGSLHWQARKVVPQAATCSVQQHALTVCQWGGVRIVLYDHLVDQLVNGVCAHTRLQHIQQDSGATSCHERMQAWLLEVWLVLQVP